MQPGDNFRILASVLYDAVSGHQDWADIPKRPDGTPKATHTRMLTVWRKLHVEIDSMAAEYDTGNSTAITDTQLTDSAKNWAANQFNSYDENWELCPDTSDWWDNWFHVTGTTATQITVDPGSNMTQHGQAGDPYRVEFKGWDPNDDDELRGHIPDPLTSPGSFLEAFKKAYVRVLISGDNGLTPWHYNFGLNVGAERAYNAQHQQHPWAQDYWRIHFMGAYEPGWPSDGSYDNDPDTEECTSAGEYAGTASIYYEVLRDCASQWGWSEAETAHARKYTELHEAGEVFGLPHDEISPSPTHVMWVTTEDSEEDLRKAVPLIYRDSDINRIRYYPKLPPP